MKLTLSKKVNYGGCVQTITQKANQKMQQQNPKHGNKSENAQKKSEKLKPQQHIKNTTNQKTQQ